MPTSQYFRSTVLTLRYKNIFGSWKSKRLNLVDQHRYVRNYIFRDCLAIILRFSLIQRFLGNACMHGDSRNLEHLSNLDNFFKKKFSLIFKTLG